MLGSFRDPAGFVFEREGALLRQVNRVCREDYDLLMGRGLYAELVQADLLVPHEEVDTPPLESASAYKVLRPERVSFVSYPSEWCFSQLKDAALATLVVQKRAVARGLSLKDASAYNVQFRAGRPLWIDTLSFERLPEGRPWVAYRQFCQHFLAPLALMSLRDVRLSQLLRAHLDGIPLDLASALLPFSTRLRPALLTHLHLHARWERRYAGSPLPRSRVAVSRASLLGLLDHLESTVRGLKWTPGGTVWGDYYADTSYSPEAFEHKRQVVAAFLDRLYPANVWDLGGNVGLFSRLASDRGIPTVCFDIDPAAVEKNYLQTVERRECFLLPLMLDLGNPTPGMGWLNRERQSLVERGPADTVLALALVHHLAISNHLPFDHIARLFAVLGRRLIVEFVPPGDSQVRRLLALRTDNFRDYRPEGFEQAFRRWFEIRERIPLRGSERTLYLMERRDG